MRKLLIITFLFGIILNSYSTNYYFDSNAGNDSWNGTTITTPKKSGEALQVVLNNLQPGDAVYLKRGSVWGNYEFLISGRNGTSSLPITITSYGTGSYPYFFCFENISGGFGQSGNIYTKILNESANRQYNRRIEVDSYDDFYWIFNTLNYMLINGNPVAIGQYPNSSYLSYERTASNYYDYIEDDQAAWSPGQWAGGQMKFCPALRSGSSSTFTPGQWLFETVGISSSSAQRLSLSTNDFAKFNDHTLMNQFYQYIPKYFITNHPNANDVSGEWSYNHTTKLLSIYYTGTLGTVQLPNKNYALEIENSSYINISGIAFYGGIIHTVRVNNSTNINLSDCSLKYTPYSAIWVNESSDVTIERNTITNACDNGIKIGSCSDVLINNNILTNIGIHQSMGGDRDADHFIAISQGNRLGDITITNNYINGTGYSGITGGRGFDGDLIINNNIVLNTNKLLTDGAAIYNYDDTVTNETKEIKYNIISTTEQNNAVQLYSPDNDIMTQGIYMDGWVNEMDIQYNTIYGTSSALFFHAGTDCIAKYNKSLNAGITQYSKMPAALRGCVKPLGPYMEWYPTAALTTDIDCKHNQFVSSSEARMMAIWEYNTFADGGSTVDSNYYYNPYINTSTDDWFGSMGNTWTMNYKTVSEWREATTFDDHSLINNNGLSYTTEAVEDVIKLVVNMSADSTRTIDLYDLKFKDYLGITIQDSVVLNPKESMFLFRILGQGTVSNMDLITEMGWGTGIIGSKPDTSGVVASDTIWFEEYDYANNIDVVLSADCGDSAVKRLPSGASVSVVDTIGLINFCYSTDQNEVDWTEIYYYPVTDSVMLSDGSYLVTHERLNAGLSGTTPGYFGINNVDMSYSYLPNLDVAPRQYDIHGADTSAMYEIKLYSSRSGTGTGNTTMTISGETVTVNPYNNVSTLISIDSIESDDDGEIIILFDRTDGAYGYLNALIIIKTTTYATDYSPSWVRFNDINFGLSGMDSIRYAVDFNQSVGEKSFELRLDGTAGTLVDSFNVDVAGCGIRAATFTTVTGVHNLYALLDTLDQYTWMKFYKSPTAVTTHDIIDTFYLRLADTSYYATTTYSDDCLDSVKTIYDIAGFYNVDYTIPVNRANVKIKYGSTENFIFGLSDELGTSLFTYYADNDSSDGCDIVTISFPVRQPADLVDLIVVGNALDPPEVAWIYFYYQASEYYYIYENKRWTIIEGSSKYRIAR